MKLNRNILIIAGMVGATVIAFLLINFVSKQNAPASRIVTEENLKQEIQELESNILELELVFEDKDKDVQRNRELLEEKYDELNFMNQKVEDLENQISILEREKKIDKATIRELRARINEAKVEIYKKEIDILVADMSLLTQNVDSMRIVIEQKDSVYLAVVEEKTLLETQYEDCVTANTPVSPPDRSQPEVAPHFVAQNISFEAINAKGNTRKGTNFRQKDIAKLNVVFTFDGVGDVVTGNKDIYIVIMDRKGNFHFNENFSQKSEITIGGKKLISAVHTRQVYQNNPQLVTARYDLGNREMEQDRYTVKLYCQGKLIGEKKLLVR